MALTVDGRISLDFGAIAAVLVSSVRGSSSEAIDRGVWVSKGGAFSTFDVTFAGGRWVDGSSATRDSGILFCSNVEGWLVDILNGRAWSSALRSIIRDFKLSLTGLNSGSSFSDSIRTGAL